MHQSNLGFCALAMIALAFGCSSSKQKADMATDKQSVAAGAGATDPAVSTPDGAASSASSEIPARREFPVNSAISPCADFYQHTCSKVIAGFKLRDDRSRHTFSFNDSYERLLKTKKEFLASLKNETKLSKRGEQLQNVYLSCMNEDARKKGETERVAETLADMNKVQSNQDFENFIMDNILTKKFSPIGVDDLPNQGVPKKWDVLALYEFQTLPERSYYAKPEVTADFKTLLTTFFKTIGEDQPAVRAQAVLDFETQFAQTYPLPEEMRDIFAKHTQISKKDLISKFPNLKFDRFLKNIPNSTLIRDITPANFAFVNKAFGELPLDTLKDVYLVHALSGVLDEAYPEFFQAKFDFDKKHLGGPDKRPPLDERCTTMIMRKFTKEIDAELLPRIFPNFPRDKFVALAEKVRASILTGLERNTWLSSSAKAAAIRKIRTARLQLVSPKNDAEWNFNPINSYSKDKYLDNVGILNVSLMQKMLKEIKTTRNTDIWDMGPLMINAYYSESDNKFVLPVGILQYPFYDPSLPDEANLGGVGTVIGHELGHSIDDKGSRYDESGRLHSWMSPQDLTEFEKRGSRLITLFDKAGVNGKLTQGENIGDFVGVTSSYRAAFPDGVGTMDQKRNFFYEYGRVWCEVMRPKYKEKMIKVDPHSFGEARVNQQVKQQAGFVSAFQCKPGDPMYIPEEDRVQIW